VLLAETAMVTVTMVTVTMVTVTAIMMAMMTIKMENVLQSKHTHRVNADIQCCEKSILQNGVVLIKHFFVELGKNVQFTSVADQLPQHNLPRHRPFSR